jgi:hypothetical protein
MHIMQRSDDVDDAQRKILGRLQNLQGFAAGLSRCFAEAQMRATAAPPMSRSQAKRPAPDRQAEECSRAAKAIYFFAFFLVDFFFVDFLAVFLAAIVNGSSV